MKPLAIYTSQGTGHIQILCEVRDYLELDMIELPRYVGRYWTRHLYFMFVAFGRKLNNSKLENNRLQRFCRFSTSK